MNVPLEKFRQNILKIKDQATERSYYKDISNFIVEFAESEGRKDFFATPEESSTVIDREIGFPDITLRQGNRLVGWIEVKLPDDNLDSEKFQNQFKKYKDSLENILFTNLREWQLWQWDDKGNSIKEIDLLFDITNYNITEEEKFKDVLLKFFEGRPYEVRTPKQLALALAKKTKLLSKQVEESFNEGNENSDLQKLKETFEKTLIQNISVHQFSNMVAETMAYSLFLAALEHAHRGNGAELTLTNAIDYLPTNIPILADLYSLIKKVSVTIPTIYKATQLLVEQLNYSDIERVHQKLVEHKPGEDPVIQFYEPFLHEYDPKEREARGVYYTPKPVVDYIIRSIDWLLRNKFNKAKGLADESVNLLDPATGTGTFLMSAIQEIYRDIKKENTSLGDEMVKREFDRVVLSHILKHFYGFELLIAPYAIAHLKLTLEVERLGFDFALTKKDSDPDNDRFKVYLANTLDNPEKPPQSLFGFDSIPQESEKAREIKQKAPIIAIIGNPPYSGISMNMGPATRALVERYKYIDGKKIIERGALQLEKNLNDDYVKFISFAQDIIEKRGFGVVAMITNNGYLDNPTLRGLRKSLMNSFDEIYLLNLFGSTKKGDKDESVFNIQLGTAIFFLIKYKKPTIEKKVYYCEMRGSKLYKFDNLLTTKIDTTDWKEIKPRADKYFFVYKNEELENEYQKFYSIKELFRESSIGLITARDNFVVKFDREDILENLGKLENNISFPPAVICDKLGISEKRGWDINKAKKDYLEIKDMKENYIRKVTYKPFDDRWIFYHKSLIWSMSFPTMKQLLDKSNLVLLFPRQAGGEGYSVYVSNKIFEGHSITGGTSITFGAPLYHFPENGGSLIPSTEREGLNLNIDFIKKFSKKLNLRFVTSRGNLIETFGPQDVFYYVYAIFHSPTYRSRYAEQLKSDFPCLPFTGNKKLFLQLVSFGNELVNLHLLGDNPFDESKTIFNKPDQWNIKIGGEKPEDLDDWKVNEARYDVDKERVYVNTGQYFEGIEKDIWEFMIGGYRVCEKWLKDRKKAERTLSTYDLKHYMKIVVSLRETIRIMGEIDKAIPSWPIK